MTPEWGREYVREVCDVIWDVETEFDLLNWHVIGVHPWPLLRMPIYYAITQQLGFFGDPHPAKAETDEGFDAPAAAQDIWRSLLVRERRSSGGRTFWMRWLPGLGRDVLVTHSRKLGGIDVYTQAVAAQLGKNSLVVDRTPAEVPAGLDLRSILELNRKWMKSVETPSVSAADVERFAQVIAALESRLGVNLQEFVAVFENRVRLLSRQSTSYARFFKLAKTKRLIVTDSYFSVALMAGARAAGVHIVELQHGFISRYHLGYSYPRGQASPYMADELWTFGQYWIDETPLPASIKTRVIGAPYVEALAAANTEPNTAHRIVFTSQGAIGEQLLPLALEAARAMPHNRIIFRLHPSESLADFEAKLSQLGEIPANFELNARTPNIFGLLASAETQVGVFSTTLLEGMALGCKTAILALPGYEYLQLVVERGDASIARNADELVQAIESAATCADPKYYYAKPTKRLL